MDTEKEYMTMLVNYKAEIYRMAMERGGLTKASLDIGKEQSWLSQLMRCQNLTRAKKAFDKLKQKEGKY